MSFLHHYSRNSFFLLIIIALIAGVFYFDKFSIIGGDVSFYLDISYLLSSGHKFLVDFFDYRVPVFPLLFSIVYKLGLSDFANRYLASVFLYSLYTLTIYFLSLFISKSPKKSALVAIITFLSISSRQFDPGREMEVPLFYHTLELISVFILLKTAWSERHGNYSIQRHGTALILSGILFGLVFVGRQVHVLPPILILGYLLFNVYKNGFGHAGRLALKLALPFFVGSVVAAIVLLKLFYMPGHDLLNQARIWLFEIPKLLYLSSHPILGIARKIVATFHTGLAELRYVYLPLFWLIYVLAIPYFYKNFVASGLGLKMSLKKIYDENRLAIELIIASFILSITTTMTTGFGGTNHQAPFFTLYALVLAFLIANFNFKKYKRTPAYLFFLIIFILPNLYRFTREERVIMQKSYNHKSAAKLPEKIAQGLINAGLTKENPVLVLGAYPVVARLAGYKPFGGYLTDVYLFSPSKIYGEEHLKSLSEKINKVDIAYKLPDYPNLDWIKETNSNAVYLYIEEYVKNNFKAVEIIKEEYAPDQEVIIYKRIKLKR
ncbi:MAG: hypothetical protein A2831_00565 [Candidatus Yanofskybacteria bacterium RIFCSPHIGHO2_01_FULL_44_17]|uniref:Glycosyltransferase RgtA/B/C/D-like domain-containing protein n=1 Tax=Candidatus Yanofskybacteria bacterium RIFCSPHIGHO2_01_FULL_44_17 TaxID=1802668 RepID=A0A1F8EXS0_9BACT|nr:MAG: hypothetical protein A2831_00565 [Candidatus Yanofskybacteria bacterium RIFCSPHIGHO2_01_FULL_44_17]